MSLTELVNERSVTGSPAERFTSRDPEAFEVPRGREEEWRFTPARRLRELFEPFTPTGRVLPEVSAPAPASWAVVPMDDPAVGQVLQPADRVSALAWANCERALVVTIPAGAELAEPVVVTLRGEPGLTYGHLVIDAGANSHATVIVEHVGEGTVAANVEAIVGDGAQLTAVSVQNWDAGAVHLAAHAGRVGRDASFKHVVVTLGGELVRIAPTVTFAGPGGSAELIGVNFAGAGQHFESRLYIDHGVPDCRSDALYKNALLGDTARTVWVGDVRIRPAATGTSTYEMNRNLLLSDGARADSVPNLEIETGDILGAGHASATGRFDDLQLFYLQSRGIPHDEAQRLVVRGFFADAVERIGVPDLQDRIMTAIEARLGNAASEESTTE
ncbi:MAG TPA: Fe-S cluster assembly protein SufD [Jatrophihabitantaceae bacterium]|nr:Fe-S cluster assembly protein SufD [Jatrophihabitantaceae bacterium]